MDYTERLTPENSMLIMVDFLDGFLPGLRTIDRSLFRANSEALAQIGKIFNLPTIILGEEGGFRGKFFPEVMKHLDHGVNVERFTPSAWDEPEFVKTIKEIDRKKVIIGGISLDICTTMLTLDLLRNGYEVFVVVDVSGSDTPLNETAAMMRMTQAGAVMTSWGSLASELMKDWRTPEGPQIGELYQLFSYWGNHAL